MTLLRRRVLHHPRSILVWFLCVSVCPPKWSGINAELSAWLVWPIQPSQAHPNSIIFCKTEKNSWTWSLPILMSEMCVEREYSTFRQALCLRHAKASTRASQPTFQVIKYVFKCTEWSWQSASAAAVLRKCHSICCSPKSNHVYHRGAFPSSWNICKAHFLITIIQSCYCKWQLINEVSEDSKLQTGYHDQYWGSWLNNWNHHEGSKEGILESKKICIWRWWGGWTGQTKTGLSPRRMLLVWNRKPTQATSHT